MNAALYPVGILLQPYALATEPVCWGAQEDSLREEDGFGCPCFPPGIYDLVNLSARGKDGSSRLNEEGSISALLKVADPNVAADIVHQQGGPEIEECDMDQRKVP